MKQRTFIRRSLNLCAVVLLGTALVPACSSKKGADHGGLMLEILTDGSAIDRVDVDIASSQKDLLQNSYKVPSEAHLPTTIAIVSSGNAAQTVDITIVGWQDGIPFDRRDSIVTQIPADRVAALRVVLSARCAGHVSLEDDKVVSDCAEGTTCDPSSADASCTDASVPASNLGSYAPGDEDRDAGPASTGGDSGASSTGGGDENGGNANGGASANGGSSANGGASAGSGGEPTGPACKKTADCTALLPVTTPKGCAIAACTAQKCVFSAIDGDKDGHATKVCAAGGVEIQLGDDCDDGDATVYPGSWDGPSSTSDAGPDAELERCDNIDQDCDGTPDNGKLKEGASTKTCACDPAHLKPCYEYPNGVPIDPATLNVGICHQGMQACSAGVPGGCMGAVGPGNETCNAKDDDCNNVVDDNAAGAVAQCPDADNDMYCGANCKVACSPPAGYRPQVQCLAGADCNDNSAAVHPGATELCGDGVDSNCTGGDSETFPNLGTACTAGSTGVCKRKGTFVCSSDKKSAVCNAKIVAPQNGSSAASTDTDIDLSTAHAGYNPAWDWNCDGNVTADTLVQEGTFRAAACSANYVGACNIYSQAECGQGGFFGTTFFNCEAPGGVYLSGNQYCGHFLNYVGCNFDFYDDNKCDYLTNTYTANNQQLTCE